MALITWFVLLTGEGSLVCHVNMLKEYHSREYPRMEVSTADVAVPVSVATVCSDVYVACDADAEDDGVVSHLTHQQRARVKNSEVLRDVLSHLLHLSGQQRGDVMYLINDFPPCLMTCLLAPQFCSMILMWVMLLRLSSMHTV